MHTNPSGGHIETIPQFTNIEQHVYTSNIANYPNSFVNNEGFH